MRPPAVCYQCGGHVRRLAVAGRTVKARGVMYAVPTDLAIPTCERCGEEWLDGEDTKALQEVIDRQRDNVAADEFSRVRP